MIAAVEKALLDKKVYFLKEILALENNEKKRERVLIGAVERLTLDRQIEPLENFLVEGEERVEDQREKVFTAAVMQAVVSRYTDVLGDIVALTKDEEEREELFFTAVEIAVSEEEEKVIKDIVEMAESEEQQATILIRAVEQAISDKKIDFLEEILEIPQAEEVKEKVLIGAAKFSVLFGLEELKRVVRGSKDEKERTVPRTK